MQNPNEDSMLIELGMQEFLDVNHAHLLVNTDEKAISHA
jgi:hypothetical protein